MWHQDINTAPKDRDIIFFGRWKPYDILDGGEKCMVIARWSTLRADGTGQHWMTGLGPVESWNVNWTHWCELPDVPDGVEEPKKPEPIPLRPQEEVDQVVKQWFLDHPNVRIYPDKLAEELKCYHWQQVLDAFIFLDEEKFLDDFTYKA